MTVSEYVRAPFVALVLFLREAMTGYGNVWLWGGGLLVFELLWAAIAFGMMPFAAAAGERTRDLYRRSCLLTWWSTSVLAVALPGALVVSHYLPQSGTAQATARIALLIVLCWLAVWLRSGSRTAGTHVDEESRERMALCARCGYRLVGLSLEKNCPECGQAIAASLPARRVVPGAAARAGRCAWCFRLPWTAFAVLTNRSFFDTLAVHRGHRQAVRLLVAACLVNAVIFTAGVQSLWPADSIERAMIGGGAYLLVQIALASACVLLASRLGWRLGWRPVRPVQPVAITVFYAFPCFVVPTVLLAASAASIRRLTPSLLMPGVIDLPVYGLVAFRVIAGAVIGLCCVPGLLFWGRRTYSALQRTRFASA